MRTFNYGLNDDYHHLNNADYAICFRRENAYCTISYIAATAEGESFYLSGHPNNPSVNAKAGETGCPADFISIPKGHNGGAGTGCGVCFFIWYHVLFKADIIYRIMMDLLTTSADIVEEDSVVRRTPILIPFFTRKIKAVCTRFKLTIFTFQRRASISNPR